MYLEEDSLWNRLNCIFASPSVARSFLMVASVFYQQEQSFVCNDSVKWTVKRKKVGNIAVNNQTREREKKIKNIPNQQRPKPSKIKKKNPTTKTNNNNQTQTK